MEYVLVWILVFAGATIGLLATFLIASERELRVQQEEVDKIAAAESSSERVAPADIRPNTIIEEHAALDAESQSADDIELRTQVTKLQTWLADAQARNFEIDAAYRKVGDEAVELREQLATLERELGAHHSAAERWLEAGRILSDIMGKRAAVVKNDEEFDQALMRLATILTDEAAPIEVAASNRSVYGPIQNGEIEQPKVNGVDNGAAFHELNTTKSDAPVSEAGSDTLWQKNRGGIVAIGVFLLIIGALVTQVWRLRPNLSANEHLSSEAARVAEMNDVQSKGVANQDAKRATDNQVVKTPNPAPSPKLSRDGDSNLQQSDALLKKASFTARRPSDTTPKSKSISKKTPGSHYAAVRGGPVYREPDEKSAAVGEVEAGMEVLVVNAKSGWLEIRSKHGRAPGFIRSDIAVPQTVQ